MKSALTDDLRAIGVRRGDALLVHSSLSALGGIAPGDVIDALLDALGEQGTLIMPALSFGTVTRASPVFDRAATPSCVGYLTEYFRASVPGTIRSMHPTHSCCALGAHADFFTRDHHLDDTPVGAHSPFRKLRDAGGKLLFIGCGTQPNTSMHGVEELASPDYLFSEPIVYTLRDGHTAREKTYTPHGFRDAQQRYERLEPLLNDREIARGKLLAADSVLMDARAVWEKAHAALLRDSHYFVDIAP
ncbi:MAG: AAC(3) family N-acetyltransferase [Christensenellales bacterium]|jgi:aminoglycoside 3-N-acetyltransferase